WAGAVPTLPPPEQPEALSMPGNNRGRFHDHERRSPAAHVGCPKKAVSERMKKYWAARRRAKKSAKEFDGSRPWRASPIHKGGRNVVYLREPQSRAPSPSRRAGP